MNRPCRLCGAELSITFADLGLSPLANSYVQPDRYQKGETFFPLHAYVCRECFLVQLEQFESPVGIFSDYLYFSSYSSSWLRHAEAYASKMIQRFGLNGESHVVEIASNDGYLLQYFVSRGIPARGVEPAANVAKVAIDRGVPTEVAFFGRVTAERLVAEGKSADLMAANNVLAHVPDILDFASGFKILLKPEGIGTFEFPHLLQMIQNRQFDTIYHEHFSYLSLGVVISLLERVGLRVFDVEELLTHGGSIRVFFTHKAASHAKSENVSRMVAAEAAAGLQTLEPYTQFAGGVIDIKLETLTFLIEQSKAGKRVCAYGAAAKGNTFLNYCGIGPELIPLVADKSPYKQGTKLPGSRIPVVSAEQMLATRPDYVMILPWNLANEIIEDLSVIREWGGQFVTAIPELAVR